MLAKVTSCAVIGLDGAIVEVEVDTSRGLPSLAMIGIVPNMIWQYPSLWIAFYHRLKNYARAYGL